MLKSLPFLLAGCLCLPTAIAAQEHPRDPGQVVRVTTDGEQVQGTVAGQTGEALTLKTGTGSRTIPLASISGMEVRNGKNRGKGALIGAGIGVLVGGILAPLTSHSESCDCDASLTEASTTGEAVLLGALVGGSIGGLVGAFVLAPYRWTPHPVPTETAFQAHPTGAGWRVGLRFSF